ncbi:hypothetical protein OH76DRAFT_1488941 [Lentinus brumalis]|uniref:Uncharacterized protein n=1 Tax=Lentinus brumalis TaxID=2498619 RepID=A0A371CP66_9APHY|nr:hypothetical protein OH76DRAFT_1488941 [Polyporus brumalis]
MPVNLYAAKLLLTTDESCAEADKRMREELERVRHQTTLSKDSPACRANKPTAADARVHLKTVPDSLSSRTRLSGGNDRRHIRRRACAEYPSISAFPLSTTRSMASSRDVATYLNVSGIALANLSQTADTTSDEVQLALWYEVYNMKDSMINVALLTMFFGLLTVLAGVAAYVLLSKQIERRRSALMLLAIVTMWITILAYWVANIVAVVEAYTVLRDLTTHLSNWMLEIQDCLSFLPAAASSAFSSCSIFAGSAYGVLAGLCCLLTNVAATSLIEYRAWCVPCASFDYLDDAQTQGSSGAVHREHRCIIMSYLRGSSRRKQVERTLALLVESDLLYCTLWVGVVACDFIHAPPGHENSAFAHGFRYGMNGCLVPIIGMYSMLMIILCAVDRSLYERSADDLARGFDEPSIRRCGTLSELLSASSASVAAEDVGRPGERWQDVVKEAGEKVRFDKLVDASL